MPGLEAAAVSARIRIEFPETIEVDSLAVANRTLLFETEAEEAAAAMPHLKKELAPSCRRDIII